MRVGRVRTSDGEAYLARSRDGVIELLLPDPDDRRTDLLRDILASGAAVGDLPAMRALPAEDVRWLAPVVAPEKIIAVGLNYVDHASEVELELPKAPLLFPKLANTIIGPEEPIRFDDGYSTQVDYEAELAVVVGRTMRRIEPETALDHVFGYTLANDVSARDAQFSDGQWFRGKNFDTFCPIGPAIVTADEIPDPQSLSLQARVNGLLLQDDTTASMIFGVAELLSYASRYMTLVPGDLILTGTPSGIGFARSPQIFLRKGDRVEVSSDTIGVLGNEVAPLLEGDVPMSAIDQVARPI
jgi:2-keto-4-pentenoate hydratase/2-oxohepta-3-ene-1,7-dioic acid hydratase in catechol pathway